MEATVSRPDPVDLATPHLCGSIRLWYASHGDEESRDGARRRRQVVRASRGIARAPPGSAPGLHHLGSISGESGTPRAESIAPQHAGRAETRRGVAARLGRMRQMRSSHDDPIQGRQEAQLSLRRVLAPGPGRTLRVHLGDDTGRPGRARSAPRVGARCTGPQPARHRGRRARAPAPSRPVAPDTGTRAAGRRESRAAVSRRGAREPTRGAHAGGALGGRVKEA